ncbi:MAG: protein kinase domain-containing protein [Myxococcota bacterium]
MLDAPIPLGTFELHTPIGRGGMGEVWRGVHVAQGVPVAVKFLAAAPGAGARFATAFRNEVRQSARLAHPRVVLVLDHGTVDGVAAEASRGRLAPGDAYLAMEFASAGSVESRLEDLDGDDALDVLFGVLDALAHAHARGVLHRDVKPANLLFSGPRDLRPGLKVADFGLAHAFDEAVPGVRMRNAGTPEYMAPEQLVGDWADQGPWTDLFAVGCVAWHLSTGSPPFDRATRLDPSNRRAPPALPPFRPWRPVTPAMEAWIRRMLAPSPADRFRCAADAAFALRDASRPAPAGPRAPGPPPVAAPAASTGPPGPAFTLTLDTLDEVDPMPTAPAALGSRAERPPIPTSWRRLDPPRPPPRLEGAGLGLFGLRAIPFVGRLEERDRIWAALVEAERAGRPRAFVIRGVVGVGKRALARAVAERAEEVGAAGVMTAHHAPMPTGAHGLGRLAARELGCLGMDPERARDRIARTLAGLGVADPQLDAVLAQIVGGDGGDGFFAWAGARERHAALVRLVEARCVERPRIVVLEDVQWGLDAVELAEALLDASPDRRLPVLVLLTCRDDAPAARPSEARALSRLEARPDVERIHLGPLADEHQAELIRGMLALAPELADSVRRRTRGNPLFAIHLVADWVRRGSLEADDRGFHLRDGERARFPDDLHQAWKTWLAVVLRGLPSGARDALEVAAALGTEVDAEEWRRAATEAGVVVPEELVDRLLAAHLAEARPDGWCFAHAMLRESIAREATDAGRWGPLNVACARMVAASPPSPRASSRLGRHRVEAGDDGGALVPLVDAASGHLVRNDFGEAEADLALAEAAMERLALPADHVERARALLLQARLAQYRGVHDASERFAARAADVARRLRRDDLQATALRLRGMAALKRGDLAVADAMLLQGESLARRARRDDEIAACAVARATALRLRGEMNEALGQIEAALPVLRRVDDPTRLADGLVELGGTLVTLGRFVDADAPLREAEALCSAAGYRSGRARALNNLGEALRRQGDNAEAAGTFRAALAILEAIGDQHRVFPLLNLGLTLVADVRFDEALPCFEAGLAMARRQGRLPVAAVLLLGLVTCHAARGDWLAWDRDLAEAQRLLDETGLVERDVAEAAALAARLAEAAGEATRAAAASGLAERQEGALAAASS